MRPAWQDQEQEEEKGDSKCARRMCPSLRSLQGPPIERNDEITVVVVVFHGRDPVSSLHWASGWGGAGPISLGWVEPQRALCLWCRKENSQAGQKASRENGVGRESSQAQASELMEKKSSKALASLEGERGERLESLCN